MTLRFALPTALSVIAWCSIWMPSAAVAQAAPDGAGAAPRPYVFRHIVIGDSEASSAALVKTIGSRPYAVTGVPALDTKDFASVLNPFFGTPITDASVRKLGNAIGDFLHSHDRPVVNVNLPGQYQSDLEQGIYRLVVLVGHYSGVQFKPGKHWFSQDLILSELGVKPGDEIKLSDLNMGVNWTNTNPYRRVQVLLNPVNKPPGQADLDIAITDAFPARLAFSCDDLGNDIIGQYHFTAAASYANLWGLDHQVTFQFQTTNLAHVFQSYSLDYRAPLPWHHYLELTAGVAAINATAASVFKVPGRDYLGDLKYVVPFSYRDWTTQVSAGIDYKQLDNGLLFLETDSTTLLDSFRSVSSTVTSIAQFTASIGTNHNDKLGAWGFGLNGFLSPGNFNARNTDNTFGRVRYDYPGYSTYNIGPNDPIPFNFQNPPRLGAAARYVYGTAQVLRRIDLPHGFQISLRGNGQLASTNLQGTEEMSIGGQETVRGYGERIESGDNGWNASGEIWTPPWREHLPFLSKHSAPLSTRVLAFYDVGKVYSKIEEKASDLGNRALMSTGIGIRQGLGNNYSLNADYGWQLRPTEHPQLPHHSGIDFTVSLAY